MGGRAAFPVRIVAVEILEESPLGAEIADRHSELDHGDGESEGAEQCSPEQLAGREQEEQARAEPDRETGRGRSAAAKDDARSLAIGGQVRARKAKDMEAV